MARKEKLVVTIVDENGLRQFNLTRAAQKLGAALFIIVLCLVVAGYFIMSSITTQLEEMKASKQQAFAQFQSVQEQNILLKDDIDLKSKELLALRERMGDLESVINIQSYSKDSILPKDFELEGLGEGQRATILQVVPNGSPLEVFDTKQKSTKKPYSAVLLTEGYRPPARLVNSGYNYYTSSSQPVRATADGIIESVRDDNQKYGYGNLVRVVHALGFSTAYTNLEKVVVKKGDFVSKGEVIGFSTPSPKHDRIGLYYEVRFLSEGLDTLSFIEWDTQNFKSIFDSKENGSLDLKNLIWTLNDIVKLNDMYSHFVYANAESPLAKPLGRPSPFLGGQPNYWDYIKGNGHHTLVATLSPNSSQSKPKQIRTHE